VFFGALLWSIGLFILTGVIHNHVMARHPHLPATMRKVFAFSSAGPPIALLCLLAGLWYVRRGLSSVTQLRTRLAAVHKGDDRRVGGTYPSEVQPLVDDLNALLAHQEQTVQRAVGKAGDLAHGLKTPLALLAQEAERAAAAGQDGLADSIGQQVDRMRRQIDHHLAQARAAASGATPGAHTALADSVDGLVRTMQRLYASKNLEFDVSLPGAVNVRAHRQDLDEMLGNLLDNACKWTASRIHVEAVATPAAVTVTIDDDGPGIAEPLRAAMLQRGVRADEAAPGSGFGLAIVRDLAELYGGSVSLSQSPLGGLRAYLELPRA
jgi:signal transduction histidine kinase